MCKEPSTVRTITGRACKKNFTIFNILSVHLADCESGSLMFKSVVCEK